MVAFDSSSSVLGWKCFSIEQNRSRVLISLLINADKIKKQRTGVYDRKNNNKKASNIANILYCFRCVLMVLSLDLLCENCDENCKMSAAAVAMIAELAFLYDSDFSFTQWRSTTFIRSMIYCSSLTKWLVFIYICEESKCLHLIGTLASLSDRLTYWDLGRADIGAPH